MPIVVAYEYIRVGLIIVSLLYCFRLTRNNITMGKVVGIYEMNTEMVRRKHEENGPDLVSDQDQGNLICCCYSIIATLSSTTCTVHVHVHVQ